MDNKNVTKEDHEKIPPFLIIPLELLGNIHFINWNSSNESKVWYYMYRHVVRGRMDSNLNIKLYDEFFKKGLLVMSMEHKEVASFLGLKDVSSIGKVVKSMISKGLIIEHKIKWRGRSARVYEFGTHSHMKVKGKKRRSENIYMLTHFEKLKIDEEYSKFLVKD